MTQTGKKERNRATIVHCLQQISERSPTCCSCRFPSKEMPGVVGGGGKDLRCHEVCQRVRIKIDSMVDKDYEIFQGQECLALRDMGSD